MRAIAQLSVRRRVSVVMTAIAMAVFGVVGFGRLSLGLLPDLRYPSFTVRTEMADTAPAEIENLVTRPVEEALGVLRGLQGLRSVSRSGVSEVTLEFDWKAELDLLSMDIREKLDRLDLPTEAESPIVLRYDPSLDPILRIAYTGPADLAFLRRVAERTLQPELEVVPGVAAAQIRGGLEEEIQVDLDQGRLAALGIPLSRVRDIVGASNLNLPGGTLETAESRLVLRLVNEYDSLEEIGGLLLRAPDPTDGSTGAVRLQDVATVRRGAKEREEITRFNGKECVEIAIYKEGEANTVEAARQVRTRIAELQTTLPEGHELAILFDQSRFIERSLTEVRNAALVGGLLAVLVLFLFLRDVRSTVVIATSIPLSVLATFVAMYRLDVSLNIMSLGGLTLGIGMLVDNSIVVLEAIHRQRTRGLGLIEAAVEGTAEVGAAVVASTLTTIAVFLPIVFVEGIAGQLFGDLSLTVTFSLLASLAVAVTMIPMLSSLGGGSRTEAASVGAASAGGRAPAPTRAPVGPEEMRPLGRISDFYGKILESALRRPYVPIGISAFLLVLSLLAIPHLGTELVPAVNEGEFYFEVQTPEGTPLSRTDQVLARMESIIAEQPGIERFYTTVGSRQVAGGLSLNDRAENLGQVHVVLSNRSDETAQEATIEQLREEFSEIPDLQTRSGRPSYFSLRTPVEVFLFGEDLSALRDYSLELAGSIDREPGLADVRSSLEAGSPELRIRFDREKLARLGLDMRELSETLRSRVFGTVPTRFKEADRQIDIRIRNREEDRATVQDVRALVVSGPNGEPIPLVSVASIEEGRGPAEIHRLQQQRAAIITANLAGASLGRGMDAVADAVAATPPPAGITVELGGQGREMESSFTSLRFALALAVFLVYLVMAGTFESLVHPFVVLFTIPLAIIGVVLALAVTDTPISVIVLIGTVMLVGIVVNNAIVLIDTVNQLRRAGVEKTEAIIQGGHIRLRPILMTTTTTVLGLLPMALSVGEGAELRAPLALTVSAGLLFSTALTLVVIPAVYRIVPSRIGVQR